jgi:hypothetical protein
MYADAGTRTALVPNRLVALMRHRIRFRSRGAVLETNVPAAALRDERRQPR